MKFLIDAGHGGRDPGAIGPTGLKEKDVTLSISTRLAAIAMKRGHFPVQIRIRDETQSLKYRADYANRHGGKCFISIHCNSHTTSTAHGIEVFTYRQGSAASSSLAKSILVAWKYAFPDHTIRGHKKSGMYVVKETRMPAVLVEAPFISNPLWEPWLREEENHQEMAETIMSGIEAWEGAGK